MFEDDADEAAPDADPFHGFKARTVKELEAWIASHVRFDVRQAAEAAPLDFGPVLEEIEAAEAQPGRGRKVVEITYAYQVPPDTRGAARMLTARAWKRADGSATEAPTCDHSVLGVVAAGRQYGRTFQVCIAKDRCTVHWKHEIKEREKNAKLRAQGKGSHAAQREQKAEETYDQKWKRAAAERKVREEAWSSLRPHLSAEAFRQIKTTKALTPKQVKYFEDQSEIMIDLEAAKTRGFKWSANLALTLLVSEIDEQTHNVVDTFDAFVKACAAPLGLDVKRLAVVRDQHTPASDPKAPPSQVSAKATKGKAQKKKGGK